MRKLLCALSLSSALVFAFAVHAAAPNFAGTWTLDKSKSQGLDPRTQNAEGISWVITQDAKTISIETKMAGGGGGINSGAGGGTGAAPATGAPVGAPAGGGGQGQGGGQGGGRGMGMGGPRVYNLDGTETSGETGRGKFVRKATLSSDGKTLELTQKSTFQGPDGNEIVATSTDKLSLSADGKVLTVARHNESPRGATDSTWVLNKN